MLEWSWSKPWDRSSEDGNGRAFESVGTVGFDAGGRSDEDRRSREDEGEGDTIRAAAAARVRDGDEQDESDVVCSVTCLRVCYAMSTVLTLRGVLLEPVSDQAEGCSSLPRGVQGE